jgi:YidC/Oxa1 family membrane protein insertase
VFDFLAGALAFFYDLVPNYAIAIALFTFTIMLILSPLSIKSTRSMIAMQRLQPELKKLQAAYKEDREGLQRETMALYQANKVNPFAACLPTLATLPVFFILYRILHGLTRRGDDGTFDPGYIAHDTALYKALDKSTEMMSFGMDLSKSALKELQTDGLLTALPYFILVALVGFTQWYQTRQISGRTPQASVNPQQQMITKLMPAMFVIFSISFPAGLVVYFFTQNLVRVGQQYLVTHLEFAGGSPDIVLPTPLPPVKSNGKGASSAKAPAPNVAKPLTPGRVTPSGARQQRKRKKR